MNENRTPFFHSIRTRLVIVSILIEVTMLGLLIANSLRLMTQVMEGRTEARLQTVSPLLSASLGARLFERETAEAVRLFIEFAGQKFTKEHIKKSAERCCSCWDEC